jgi:GNAT superfamily N-acetyltransferase
MEFKIREWRRDDLSGIQKAWLAQCSDLGRPDMRLIPNANAAMREWLRTRFQLQESFGLIAEFEGELVGFLVARIDEWDSAPPVIEPRRIGIIDAVYVAERRRRQGISGKLIDTVIQKMRAANVVAVETIYDSDNSVSESVWRKAGFVPWMVHAYRML